MVEAAEKTYTCPYCEEKFDSDLEKDRHIQTQYKWEAQYQKATGEMPPRLGGLTREELCAQTLEFAEALEVATPDLNPKTRKQILLAYDYDPSPLSRDVKALEDFLDDNDFSEREQRCIVRQLFPETAGSVSRMGFGVVLTPNGPMPVIFIYRG